MAKIQFEQATVKTLNAVLTATNLFTEDEIKAIVVDVLFEFAQQLWLIIPGCTYDRFTGEAVCPSLDNEDLIRNACVTALKRAYADAEPFASAE